MLIRNLVLLILLLFSSNSIAEVCCYIITDDNDDNFLIAYNLSKRMGHTGVTTNVITLKELDKNEKQLSHASLLLTIGEKSTSEVLKKAYKSTILAGNISMNNDANLSSISRDNLYITHIEPAPLRYIGLARKHIPKDGKISIILSSKATQLKKDLLFSAKTLNANIRIYESNKNNIMHNIEDATSKDIVIAIYDPEAMNRENASYLLYAAYLNKTPVIGYSRAFLEAGAAISIYSTKQDIAKNIEELAVELLQGHQPSDHRLYSNNLKIEYNSWVAENLRIVDE